MEQRDHGTSDVTGPGDRADGQRDGKLRALVAQQAALASRAAGATGVGGGTGGDNDKGDLYRSMGDGFTRAFELAITPALFGAMGYGLDRWLGTRPILMTVLFLVALVAMLLRTWYGYAYRMQQLEAAAPWAAAAKSDAGAEAATP